MPGAGRAGERSRDRAPFLVAPTGVPGRRAGHGGVLAPRGCYNKPPHTERPEATETCYRHSACSRAKPVHRALMAVRAGRVPPGPQGTVAPGLLQREGEQRPGLHAVQLRSCGPNHCPARPRTQPRPARSSCPHSVSTHQPGGTAVLSSDRGTGVGWEGLPSETCLAPGPFPSGHAAGWAATAISGRRRDWGPDRKAPLSGLVPEPHGTGML